MSRARPRSVVALAMGLTLLTCGDASALTLKLGGYTASPFLTMSTYPSGLRVGADGTVYLLLGASGIDKVTPGGVESPWSTANVIDLAVSPSGGAFGVGRWPCNCLVQIAPDGSYSIFAQDSVSWQSVALGPNGTLFAAGTWDGPNGGVFQIDPSTGERTLVVATSLSRYYGSLDWGTDGHLYAIAWVWTGAGYETSLSRLDGAQFTPLGLLPHGGYGLAQGPTGTFWTMTSFDYGSGYPIGEIWTIDSATGAATLFASVSWVDSQFWGVGYDAARARLYIGDPSHRLLQPMPVIYSVTGGFVPARPVSWGSVKARYR